MKQILPIVLAAVLATPAWADLSASAQLWNMSYSLEDLDPTDGIAPGITFNISPDKDYAGAGLLYLLYQDPPIPTTLQKVEDLSQYKHAMFEPLSTTSTIQPINIAIKGDGTIGGTTLEASIHVHPPVGTDHFFSLGASVMNDQRNAYAPTFTLTPHTQVTFTASYHLEAKLFYDGLRQPQDDDSISTEASLLVYDASDQPYSYGPQYNYGRVYAVDWDNQWSQGAGYSRSGMLSGAIINTTANPLAGGVSFSIGANGEAKNPLPVPEPGAIANAFAGVALTVACLTIRRRRGTGH